MPLWRNKALNLTEFEIRNAMANSKSNNGAADFLGCGVDAYKRYAKMYIDPATDLTLWDLHKNIGAKGIPKVNKLNSNKSFKKTPINEILEGKHPKYNRKVLEKRLLDEGIFEEKCSNCGFEERRVTDFKVPLVLVFKDGDYTNFRKENMEFICYNDYFLTFDDVFLNMRRVHTKGF